MEVKIIEMDKKNEKIKSASAGNRTRVDSLEGYNSTSKLLMLHWYFNLESSFINHSFSESLWMWLWISFVEDLSKDKFPNTR